MDPIDKENVPVTPIKDASSPKVDYSPSHPKRALKPVSPSKYNNNSLGKLNFLQNNNLEGHFDCLHGYHEEIRQQLSVIELQTKQTNDDLEQLFDRLKNNNQHLNKLLESIAAYSEEVTTEGNATKSDVTKILERLSDLSPKNLEHLITNLLQTSKNDIIKEINSIIKSSESDPDDANIEVLLKLNNVERELNKLPENISKDIEKYLGKISSETTNELTEISELLRHSSNSQRSTIEVIIKKIEDLSTGDTNSDIVRLQQLVEQQTDVFKSVQNELRAQNQLNEYKDLQSKHRQLEAKYNNLCKFYESKYRDLVQLESKFTEFTNIVEKLDSKVTSIDVQKYDRLQQLHANKLSELGQMSYSSSKKRITSMPIKPADILQDILEQNNSD